MQVTLDARCMGRGQVHDYLKEMLHFPEWYGANLDALYDCLTSLPETTLTLTHVTETDAYFQRVLYVIQKAEIANPNLNVEI